MKTTYIYNIIVASAIALGFAACKSTLPDVEERGTLSVSTQEIVIENEGGQKTIEVKASDDNWELTTSSIEWIETKVEGNTITLEIKPNTATQERDAELVIYAPKSKLTKTVAVKQFGVSPALHLDQDRVVFDRKGGEKNVTIVVNGTDWSVTDPNNVPWLTFEKDASGKQINLTAKPVDKEAQNSGASRSTILILSYGTSHSILTVRQDGWQYFPIPFLKPNPTRNEILQHAQEQGYTRDTEYESGWVDLYGDDQKQVMAFRTDAIEGQVIAYYFDRDYPDELERVVVRAGNGLAFNQDALNEWLTTNGFIKVGESVNSSRGGTDINYFAPSDEEVKYLTINNYEKYYILNPDANHRGAMMEISKSSNEPQLNSEGTAFVSLPLRNTTWIRNPKYKLDEVIKYEAERGMRPDDTDEETVLNTTGKYPEVKYAKLTFVANDEAAVKTGGLYKVAYVFNIPGLKDFSLPNEPHEFVSLNPAEAGSVAIRYDVYKSADDNSAFMGRKDYNGYYSPSFDFINIAEKAGFVLKDNFQEWGNFYYINEWRNMIMIARFVDGYTILSFGNDENIYENLKKK